MKTKQEKARLLADLIEKNPGLDAKGLKDKGWTHQRHGTLREAENLGYIAWVDGGWIKRDRNSMPAVSGNAERQSPAGW